MSEVQLPSKVRNEPEHKEGYLAYKRGYVDDDCPYESQLGANAKRMSWICGWYDGMRMEKFGNLFADEKVLYEQYDEN